MNKHKSFLETPIDPDAMFSLKDIWEPGFSSDGSAVVPTRHVSLDTNVFVILREIAKMFVNGTRWNKRARIVLEYDPHCEKMAIKTFMERDEADAQAVPELMTD